RLAGAQLPAETRLDGLVEDSRFREPPEEVATEWALRQRRLARSDREHHLVRGRELLRDLEAGVPASDNEHGSRQHLVRRAVANGVGLQDIFAEPGGKLRHIGRLD